MAAALQKIEEMHGKDTAAAVRGMVDDVIAKDVVPQLAALQKSLGELLGMFRSTQMLPANQLQTRSFKSIQEDLGRYGSLLLLYKSAPAAVLVDNKKLDELHEDVDALLFTLARELQHPGTTTRESFWARMAQGRPTEQ